MQKYKFIVRIDICFRIILPTLSKHSNEQTKTTINHSKRQFIRQWNQISQIANRKRDSEWFKWTFQSNVLNLLSLLFASVCISMLQGFKTFNALYTLTRMFSSVCNATFFNEHCAAIRWFSSPTKWLKSSLYSWFLLMDTIEVFVATGTSTNDKRQQ